MKMIMKKQFLALICSIVLLCGMILGVTKDVKAAEDLLKCVDGSYLTMDNESSGSTISGVERGKHLMDGDSIVRSAGTGKITAYGATTANHSVDYVGVIVHVDRYNPLAGNWSQVTSWTAEAHNTYFVSSTKTLTVERGFYYRVRCDHFAGNNVEFPYDSSASFTDGIWIG